MKPLYCAGTTSAAAHAAVLLGRAGIPIAQVPDWEVGHLLLDVPSFQGEKLRGGGNPDTLLESLPRDITIWGGGLKHPKLRSYPCVDLLTMEDYLWENAGITARCAFRVAPHVHWHDLKLPVLIIGWGRIGKQLGHLLQAKGIPVIIAARSAADRDALTKLGYTAADTKDLSPVLPGCSVIFNTVPAPVLTAEQLRCCPDSVKIELASTCGIEGSDVIIARGLPGKLAPEASGKLIADTILTALQEVTP